MRIVFIGYLVVIAVGLSLLLVAGVRHA